MYINADFIIKAASLLGALGALTGAVIAVYKVYESNKKQSEVIKEIQEEQTLVCYGLRGRIPLFHLPSEEQLQKVQEWLLWAVTEAERELGGGTGKLKLRRVYDGKKNGYPWCDVFFDWCMVKTFGLELALKMTGQKLGCYGAGCTMSASYYRAMGRFFKSDPQPGDQIFFSQDGGKTSYHTGLVERVQGGDPLPDSQPNFMWEDLLTREQAATLMYRLAQIKGLV